MERELFNRARLIAESRLTADEADRVVGAGAVDAQGVHALLVAFPGLIEDCDRKDAVLEQLLPEQRKSFLNLLADGNPPPGPVVNGAASTGTTPTTLGAMKVGDFDGATIDLAPRYWTAEDQGLRGTCVAFAATACFEFQKITNGGLGVNADFSEEFLFYAMRHKISPTPNPTDVPKLLHARDALIDWGICHFTNHSYNYEMKNRDPLSVVKVPPPAALTEATQYKVNKANIIYEDKGKSGYIPNAANKIYRLLEAKQPVALCIQTFSGSNGGLDNWKTGDAIDRGSVADPVLDKMVPSGGHCVCVVGLARSTDGTRDFFIVRNSWGTGWGKKPESHPWGIRLPDQGYGAVSAAYVDACSYELMQLTP